MYKYMYIFCFFFLIIFSDLIKRNIFIQNDTQTKQSPKWTVTLSRELSQDFKYKRQNAWKEKKRRNWKPYVNEAFNASYTQAFIVSSNQSSTYRTPQLLQRWWSFMFKMSLQCIKKLTNIWRKTFKKTIRIFIPQKKKNFFRNIFTE